jgi:hypothetical protein
MSGGTWTHIRLLRSHYQEFSKQDSTGTIPAGTTNQNTSQFFKNYALLTASYDRQVSTSTAGQVRSSFGYVGHDSGIEIEFLWISITQSRLLAHNQPQFVLGYI